MRAVVKEFIEDAIDLIDAQEYHELFTLWYLHYTEEGRIGDSDNLTELFQVLEKAGVDIYKASEYARKEIIAEHMYEYIYDILDTDPDVIQIELPSVIGALRSKLDISLIELNNIFKQVSQHIQGSFDVRREPFKIVRNKHA